MRTTLLMLALAGVFAVSAADAQTTPANAAGSTKAAPAKPQVKTLGNSFGDLIKAAAAQQKAQREAKAAEPAVALEATTPRPEAVHTADVAVDTKTAATP